MLHDYDATEEVLPPKAALGDIHNRYASASSIRQRKAEGGSCERWLSMVEFGGSSSRRRGSGNGDIGQVDPTIIVETSRHQ
jgi:hypothetical protein